MSRKNKPTKKTGPRALAMRIHRVASSMRRLGCAMDYYGGFGEIGEHGREMIGASIIARKWADKISEQIKHSTR